MGERDTKRVSWIGTYKEIVICLDDEPIKTFYECDREDATIFQLKLEKLVRDGEI